MMFVCEHDAMEMLGARVAIYESETGDSESSWMTTCVLGGAHRMPEGGEIVAPSDSSESRLQYMATLIDLVISNYSCTPYE